jgi:hypothetical protein
VWLVRTEFRASDSRFRGQALHVSLSWRTNADYAGNCVFAPLHALFVDWAPVDALSWVISQLREAFAMLVPYALCIPLQYATTKSTCKDCSLHTYLSAVMHAQCIATAAIMCTTIIKPFGERSGQGIRVRLGLSVDDSRLSPSNHNLDHN